MIEGVIRIDTHQVSLGDITLAHESEPITLHNEFFGATGIGRMDKHTLDLREAFGNRTLAPSQFVVKTNMGIITLEVLL